MYQFFTEEELATEQWQPIVGYEDLYEVSDLGRVKSLAREVDGGHGRIYKVTEKILSVTLKYGYPRLKLCKEGICKTKIVHPLVVRAFMGEIPKGLEIDHIDGVRTNNRLTNLQLLTQLENIFKQFGRKPRGSTYDKKKNRYSSKLRYGGKCFYLGSYLTKGEAEQAYYLKFIELYKTRPW